MILRRIAEGIRRQDWITVTIEFVIVVAGIFVGLQVDSWNQGRKDRALEDVYLQRLLTDMQWNVDNFRELESKFEAKATFISQLRSLPAAELLTNDSAEFMRGLNFSLYISLPAVRMATFSELESSGRISLLQSVELRDELSIFFADYQLMQRILGQPIGVYRRLVYETIPGDVAYDWMLNDNFDINSIGEASTALQSDARFVEAANAEIAYAADLIFWLRIHRRQAENILAMINQSLDHQ